MTTYLGRTVVSATEELDDAWVQVTGDRITGHGRRYEGMPADGQPPVDLGEVTVLPGFVDIHCHGGGGHGFPTTDPLEARKAAVFHATHGTTTMLASLVSADLTELAAQIDCLRELVADPDVGVAGIHLEGPFLSAARCGAHDQALLRDPAPADLEPFLDPGAITMITIAPERPHALAAIEAIVRAGIAAAVGHTDADHDQLRAGIDAGARVATHLFNGMRPFHHRDPGPVGACLTDPAIMLELIHDGVHLDPQVVRVVRAAAGIDRLCLITDAISAAGMGDGRYRLGGLDVQVTDGAARLATGSRAIAGSTLTMDRAYANAVRSGMSPVEAARATALNQSNLFGWLDRGEIIAGKRADLVLLDDDYGVVRVMRGGHWLDRRD